MGSVLLSLRGPFPLLHQPAREDSCRIFLHPKVKKRTNFLAEVGGMAESREFVALERACEAERRNSHGGCVL